MKPALSLLLILLVMSCQAKKPSVDKPVISAEQAARLDTAYLASGCFWCTEAVFERVEGVVDVVSGYTGGDRENPTYQQVSAGRTNHAEAVRVVYDPEVINYELVIHMFFDSHDPTQLNRQGPDIGRQYRSGIYYQTEDERAIAERVKRELDDSGKFGKPIVTEIKQYKKFWIAEDYHQDYYEIHPENPYIQNVSKPKVEKFMKQYRGKLKAQFQ